MARTKETSGPAGPRVGDRLARAGRGSSGVPADGAVVSLAEPLLDCEGAAALLNVRVSWVRDAARLGHLPCLRVGRHLRFTRVMLEDWLAEQVAVSSTPARAYPRPANGSGVRSSRGRFRRSTQAALLASLAENPRNKEVDDER
jgi:excisionase family DNA binding protein